MKIKATIKHKRTGKVRTEVMDECKDPDSFFQFVGEVGNKTCFLDFEPSGEIDFSIKSYKVMKVESDGWVWKAKEK